VGEERSSLLFCLGRAISIYIRYNPEDTVKLRCVNFGWLPNPPAKSAEKMGSPISW
jgi:hypothetical protein